MNNKGSTIVEAAVVFPLVLLSVMAVIYMMMFLYEQTKVQSEMHMAIRAEKGEKTKTVYTYGTAGGNFPLYTRSGQDFKVLYYNGALGFDGKGILRGTVNKTMKGTIYLIDETDLIRKTDLI